MKEKIINTLIKLKNVFATIFIIGAFTLALGYDSEDAVGSSYNDWKVYVALIIFGIFTAYISMLADNRRK